MSLHQSKLWPVHPQPFEDEVLSSWVSRIGSAADLSLTSFRKLCLPAKARQIDLDQVDDPEFFETLASGTGVSVEEVRRLGYASDEGRVYSRYAFHNPEWVAPRTLGDLSKRVPSIPYCPSCLAEDQEPYYRKSWRYAFYPVCPKHGLLTNDCPTCKRPYSYLHGVRFNTGRGGSESIGVCRFCGEHFSANPIQGLNERAQIEVIEIQGKIQDALNCGWFEIAGHTPVHVCMYLCGLRDLTNMFLHESYGEAARRWVTAEAGMSFIEKEWIQPPASIESLPAATRAWGILFASWLAEEWPSRFVSMVGALRTDGFRIRRPRTAQAAWLRHASVDNLFAKKVFPSKDEIDSARQALAKKRHWSPNQIELDHFMQTGMVPPIKPLIAPVPLEVKLNRERYDTPKKEDPPRRAPVRELYNYVVPANDLPESLCGLDDNCTALRPLVSWLRAKRATPNS